MDGGSSIANAMLAFLRRHTTIERACQDRIEAGFKWTAEASRQLDESGNFINWWLWSKGKKKKRYARICPYCISPTFSLCFNWLNRTIARTLRNSCNHKIVWIWSSVFGLSLYTESILSWNLLEVPGMEWDTKPKWGNHHGPIEVSWRWDRFSCREWGKRAGEK